MRDPLYDPVEQQDSLLSRAGELLQDITDVYRQQIPFWDTGSANNESELENLDIADINFVHYLIGKVRRYLQPLGQAAFERVSGVIDLRAIPTYCYFDQRNRRIRVYPLPPVGDANFIYGFKPLNVLTELDRSIPASMPRFMLAFLRYQIALELCNEYNVPWIPQKETTRQNYYNMLLQNSENLPSQAIKTMLKRSSRPAPYLAYISGNTP